MKPHIFLGMILAAMTPAEALPPRPLPHSLVAPDPDAAVDYIFQPTFQFWEALRKAILARPETRQAFLALGRDRGCEVYRTAWKAALVPRLPRLKQIFHTAVRSVVPREVLTKRDYGILEPEIVNLYGDRVIAAVTAGGTNAILDKSGIEILTALQAAAATADRPPAPFDNDIEALFADELNGCGVDLHFLEESSHALGS